MTDRLFVNAGRDARQASRQCVEDVVCITYNSADRVPGRLVRARRRAFLSGKQVAVFEQILPVKNQAAVIELAGAFRRAL